MPNPNKKYFAQIGVDDTVISCHVVNPSDCLDGDGAHSELVGKQFLQSIHNIPVEKWIEYSPTGEFRTNSASMLGTYDSANDVFISTKPYASWILSAGYQWEAPIAYPTDTGEFPIGWDDDNQKWFREGFDTNDWDPNTLAWV
jgi:hypothetical protein